MLNTKKVTGKTTREILSNPSDVKQNRPRVHCLTSSDSSSCENKERHAEKVTEKNTRC